MEQKTQPLKGFPHKFTEAELKARHVGNCVSEDSMDDDHWEVKKATYATEEVMLNFTKIFGCFKEILTDPDRYQYPEMAHSCAQLVIDAFLIRRSRGENVWAPQSIIRWNASPGEQLEEELDPSIWEGKKKPSANEELRWIFDSMKLEGVEPEDSPSSGAYALLNELKENKEQRRDFYKTLWPKLLTKEDAEKGGKLMDTGKETIELCKRLLKAVESEV